ncbi:MAG: CARDB domain-containing protein [Planctomycetota bacterium]
MSRPFPDRLAAEPLSPSRVGADGPAPSALPEAADPQPPVHPRKAADVLIARQSPILGVETVGPRQIKVGKESTFELTIRNSGQMVADQVVVTIGIPEWADVLGTEVSKGATTAPKAGGEGNGFQWEVGQVGPGGEEKLSLRIVPRQSRPFDLAVEWDSLPVVSRAMIEVQEPKIEMRLEGPREVLFGQSEVYRLELTNSGTGDAQDVAISLAPTGPGENLPARHKLGLLKVGEKKVIEVELTARQAGTLAIRVDAQGDGVQAHLAETITVNRPTLEMDVEAPEIQYVGTDTGYLVRVRNRGTAPAKNVAVRATIPPGTQYVSCSEGGHFSPDQASVTWTLETLDIGAEKSYELTCKLALAGLSRLKVASSAAGGLAASSDATVKVEAIADLELDVTDPSGPVRVGSEATYQVRVSNQGTKSAEEVEIVAYFTKGVEPTVVEGGRHEIGPGQVVFDKIPSLGAGQEVTFQIRAKAETAGSHICRVEVYCKPLGTRLVGEETTHFYGGASLAQKASRSQPDADASLERHGPIRTADQRPTPAPSKSQ